MDNLEWKKIKSKFKRCQNILGGGHLAVLDKNIIIRKIIIEKEEIIIETGKQMKFSFTKTADLSLAEKWIKETFGDIRKYKNSKKEGKSKLFGD